MRFSISQAVAFAVAIASGLAQDQHDDPGYDNPCKSYGIDFQDNGSYFQNKSSTEDFTFVSTFEGCQQDTANNILVDPNGDQYQCTDTPLRPDDTYQMSTCPMEKCSLWSGPWSIIIISNNGVEGQPIAYQRDFSLEVATPATKTYTPTMVISDTTTPVVESTKTITETESFTNTKTLTSPYTKSKTITTTPKRVTTTQTQIVGTITKHAFTVEPTVITKTKTLTCSVPRRQPTRDPWATITPTIVHAAAFDAAAPTSSATATTSGARRRRDTKRHLEMDRREFLIAREARLAQAIEKRGLDNSTVTITELDSSKWATSTSLVTAPTSTMTMTEEYIKSVTTTTTQTIYSGTTQVLVTITAPTPTKTKTKYTIVKTTSTITKRPTVTVTIKTAPASSTTICKAKGGKLV